MTKKLFTLILWLCMLHLSVEAQLPDSTRGTSGLSVGLHYGFLIAHRPTMYHLQKAHTLGFEINYIKTTNSKSGWQHAFNNPDLGLSFCFLDIGNQNTIGKVMGIYPFIDFPVVPSDKLALNIRIGCGLGYVQKPFSQYENYKNNAIGSHINAMINLRLMMQAALSKTVTTNLSLGLTHLSNGSVKTPNLGLNIATVSVGATKYFGNRTKIYHPAADTLIKHFDYEFYVAGFSKQIYPALGDNYFAGSAVGNFKYHVNLKSEWVAGADFFYDASIKAKLENDDAYNNAADAMRIGLHGGYHLTIGNFTTGFEAGVYVYDHYDEDGILFNRLVMNYKMSKHIFACLNLKTHYAKADYIELGLGWRR